MNNTNEKWEKKFDEKFCRVDKSDEKRGFMEHWFIRDDITGKSIKDFIQTQINKAKEEALESIQEEIWTEVSNYMANTTIPIPRKTAEKILHTITQTIEQKIESIK